jgi:hypothetical protein
MKNRANEGTLAARVERLEGLLLSAVTADGGSNTAGRFGDASMHTPDASPSSHSRDSQSENGELDHAHCVTAGLGTITIDHETNQTIYLGSDHWTSIMSEVCDGSAFEKRISLIYHVRSKSSRRISWIMRLSKWRSRTEHWYGTFRHHQAFCVELLHW